MWHKVQESNTGHSGEMERSHQRVIPAPQWQLEFAILDINTSAESLTLG